MPLFVPHLSIHAPQTTLSHSSSFSPLLCHPFFFFFLIPSFHSFLSTIHSFSFFIHFPPTSTISCLFPRFLSFYKAFYLPFHFLPFRNAPTKPKCTSQCHCPLPLHRVPAVAFPPHAAQTPQGLLHHQGPRRIALAARANNLFLFFSFFLLFSGPLPTAVTGPSRALESPTLSLPGPAASPGLLRQLQGPVREHSPLPHCPCAARVWLFCDLGASLLERFAGGRARLKPQSIRPRQ